MTRAQCAKMRMWRWRRNPLRRRSDIAEAWVVLATWVAVLVGGPLVGMTAADAVQQSAERQREERREVTAVLVDDAPDQMRVRAPGDYPVWATVRWTGLDGSRYTDEARVPPGARAGHAVRVWTDPDNKIAAEPLTPEETRLHAISGGVLAATGASGAVLAASWVVRQALERHRMARWAVEWEQVDAQKGWKAG
jgi:hypothetical protein